jgi:hypothetical protein
LDVL